MILLQFLLAEGWTTIRLLSTPFSAKERTEATAKELQSYYEYQVGIATRLLYLGSDRRS